MGVIAPEKSSKATLRKENMSNFNGIPYDNIISIGKANFMMDRRNCSLQNDVASPADILRGASRVPAGTREAPLRTSAWEAKNDGDSVLYAGRQILGIH